MKTPERVAQAKALRADGLNYAEIGRRLDADRGAVRRWVLGETSTEAVRRYRRDPTKRERDLEVSRRWKREHLGQPGQPRRVP